MAASSHIPPFLAQGNHCRSSVGPHLFGLSVCAFSFLIFGKGCRKNRCSGLENSKRFNQIRNTLLSYKYPPSFTVRLASFILLDLRGSINGSIGIL